MSSTPRHVAQDEGSISVRIFIDGSDADGIRFFDELLPVSTIRAILDTNSPDFFVKVAAPARLKPPTVKSHWLSTRYLRELMLFGELPPELPEQERHNR